MSDPVPERPDNRSRTASPVHPGTISPGLVVTVVVAVAAMAATVTVTWSSWGLGAPAVFAGAFGVAMIVLGVVAHRPERAISWLLLAVGCGTHLVATVVFVVQASARPPDAPALSDAIALFAYPAMFVGIAGITTRRRSGWCTDGPTAVLAVSVLTAVLALAVALSYADSGELPFGDSDDWVGVLASCDLVLAVMVARRVIGSAQRGWSSALLLTGLVIWGNGHAEVGARLFDHSYTNRSVVVLALGLGPLLVGVGALVPSMADVPAARRGGDPGEALASVLRWAAVPSVVLAVVYAAELDPVRLWVLVPSLIVIVGVASWTTRRAAELGEIGG